MTDDELDRLLLAMPLERPPSDLRANIMAATVGAIPSAPSARAVMRKWEFYAVGAAMGVATWLVMAILGVGFAGGGEVVRSLDGSLALLGSSLTPMTLTWLAIGGGISLWISQIRLVPIRRSDFEQNPG